MVNVLSVLANIVWKRQPDTACATKLYVVNLSSFMSLQRIAVDLLDELRDYQHDLFGSRSIDAQAAIGDRKRLL